jgi:hypothetical protein
LLLSPVSKTHTEFLMFKPELFYMSPLRCSRSLPSLSQIYLIPYLTYVWTCKVVHQTIASPLPSQNTRNTSQHRMARWNINAVSGNRIYDPDAWFFYISFYISPLYCNCTSEQGLKLNWRNGTAEVIPLFCIHDACTFTTIPKFPSIR